MESVHEQVLAEHLEDILGLHGNVSGERVVMGGSLGLYAVDQGQLGLFLAVWSTIMVLVWRIPSSELIRSRTSSLSETRSGTFTLSRQENSPVT